MLEPKLFAENLFDDWTNDFFDKSLMDVQRKLYGKHGRYEMLTDIKEHEDHYEVDIDLPGFKKDEIEIQLDQGYLTVRASKGLDQDEKSPQGKLIRQERIAGVLSRSFYVGQQVTSENISAKFEDGVLKLNLPKENEAIQAKNYIAIE